MMQSISDLVLAVGIPPTDPGHVVLPHLQVGVLFLAAHRAQGEVVLQPSNELGLGPTSPLSELADTTNRVGEVDGGAEGLDEAHKVLARECKADLVQVLGHQPDNLPEHLDWHTRQGDLGGWGGGRGGHSRRGGDNSGGGGGRGGDSSRVKASRASVAAAAAGAVVEGAGAGAVSGISWSVGGPALALVVGVFRVVWNDG